MNSKKQASPMKKSKATANPAHKGPSYKLIQDQQNCLLTDLKGMLLLLKILESDLTTYSLLTQNLCYHKLYQDLFQEIDFIDNAISQEIQQAQEELKSVAKELVDSDALKASDDFQLLKLKNQLQINLIQQSNNNQGLNSSGGGFNQNVNRQIQLSLREELKELVTEKFSKNAAPNFTNDYQLLPSTYTRFIPDDQIKRRKKDKSPLISSQKQPTLDNCYINDLSYLVNDEKIQNTIREIDIITPPSESFQYSCLFDFKPSNSEYLVISRMDFLTKAQNIKNYLKNMHRERIDEIQMNNNRYIKLKQQWETNNEIEKRTTEKQLKMKYPQQYEEFEFEQKHHTGILSQYTGFHNQLLGSGQKSLNNQGLGEEEEWDDFQRYRDNKVEIAPYRFRFYPNTQIYHEPFPQLITDPQDYELEYKRRQVWSLKDIELFLKAMLENPKNFWEINQALPHKTLKELAFFFQVFKKLFNLKKHFNTCQVLMSLPSQASRKQAIQEIINEVMKPIKKHQQQQQFLLDKKNMNSSSGLIQDGYQNENLINQSVLADCQGMNQIFFNVQELLQIYASQSECRRKAKEAEKYGQDSQLQGLFHFNSTIAPEYSKQKSSSLKQLSYFEQVESRGSQLLKYTQSKLSNQEITSLTSAAVFSLNLLEQYKSFIPQKYLKTQLAQTQSQKEQLLRKRRFTEHFMMKEFHSGSGRDTSKLVYLKSQFIDDAHVSGSGINGMGLKRMRISSSNNLMAGSNVNSHSSLNNFQNYNQSAGSQQLSQFQQQQFQNHNQQFKSMMIDSNISKPISNIQSFTERYFDELRRQRQIQEENEYLKMEETKNNFKLIKTNQINFQLDIQKELGNEKDFKTYMESRFSAIFLKQNSNLPTIKPITKENNIKSKSSTSQADDSDDSSSSIDGGTTNVKQRGKGFLQWQEDEKEKFIQLLKKHGRDWSAIADELPRKTDKQCRNYFQNYKHKLKLQQYIPEKQK